MSFTRLVETSSLWTLSMMCFSIRNELYDIFNEYKGLDGMKKPPPAVKGFETSKNDTKSR